MEYCELVIDGIYEILTLLKRGYSAYAFTSDKDVDDQVPLSAVPHADTIVINLHYLSWWYVGSA